MNTRRLKSDANTVNSRIMTVAGLLVDGYNSSDILQYSAVNWGVRERMTRNYIAKAQKIIDEDRQVEIRKKLILHDARLESLFNQSFENGDVKQCMDVLKEIDSFNGLKKIRQSQQESKWCVEKKNSNRAEDSSIRVLAAGFN